MSALPSPRVYQSGIVHNGKLIIFGGHVPSEKGDFITSVRSDLWEYDIVNNKWRCIYNHFTSFTESPCLIYRDKVYIFAGFGSSRTDVLIVYDTVSGKLIQETKNGRPKSAHSAVFYKNNAYLFGGFSGQHSISDLIKFDFETQEYTTIIGKGNPPSVRAHAAVVYKTDMYIIGGYESIDHNSKMYKYNFESNEWTVETCYGDIPSPRSRMSCIVLENKMYLFGGAGGKSRDILHNDAYQFDFNTNIWKQLQIEGMGGIAQFTLFYYDSQIYLFGGCHDNKATNHLYAQKIFLGNNEENDNVSNNDYKGKPETDEN